MQDVTAIDTAVAEMNTAWTAASEEMYKATQQAGGGNGDGQPNGTATPGRRRSNMQMRDDNVTDAEFEEVK